MRSAIAITAAATFFTTALAATNCNPSYNVPGSTACYTKCNVDKGQKWVPGWTMDPKSDKFIASLNLMCEKSGPNYGSFMAAAGMCMAGCAGDDPEMFNKEFAGACAWYASHKNDKCDAGTVTTTKPATTTTTTTKAGTTTKTVTGTATGTTTATGTATGTATVTTTATATTTATVTVPNGTVTVTVTDCAAPTNAVCKSGFRGKKNGRGPKDACCSSSDDCQESCVKGLCNAKYENLQVCIAGAINKRMGDGLTGHCCTHSDDCKAVCRSGVCSA